MRTITYDPNEPVVIRTFADSYAAEMARLVLHAAGIECMLLGNTYLGAGVPVRLAVRKEDVPEAIAELDAEDAAGEPATVIAVARSAAHTFSKAPQASIRLVAGRGVEEDAHQGTTVRHRSRVARDPAQPNLRQVHLIHAELHDELRAAGFAVGPGDLGENVTTRGLDVLGLPTGTRLHVGTEVIIELTGLRNPCAQLDQFQPGLLAAVLARDANGRLVRKAGVMGIVLTGGDIRPGDAVEVELPPAPHRAMEVV